MGNQEHNFRRTIALGLAGVLVGSLTFPQTILTFRDYFDLPTAVASHVPPYYPGLESSPNYEELASIPIEGFAGSQIPVTIPRHSFAAYLFVTEAYWYNSFEGTDVLHTDTRPWLTCAAENQLFPFPPTGTNVGPVIEGNIGAEISPTFLGVDVSNIFSEPDENGFIHYEPFTALISCGGTDGRFVSLSYWAGVIKVYNRVNPESYLEGQITLEEEDDGVTTVAATKPQPFEAYAQTVAATFPAKYVQVQLCSSMTCQEPYATDDNGKFKIPIPAGASSLQLRVNLLDKDNKVKVGTPHTTTSYHSYIQTPTNVDLSKINTANLKIVTTNRGGTVTYFLNGNPITPTTNSDPDSKTGLIQFAHQTKVYLQMLDLFDWAKTRTGLEFQDQTTPLPVIAFSHGTHNRFFPVERFIELKDETSFLASQDNILNKRRAIAHEFAHYMVWESPIGDSGTTHMMLQDPNSLNHGGYFNPNSADSLDEAIANFISFTVLREKYNVGLDRFSTPASGTTPAYNFNTRIPIVHDDHDKAANTSPCDYAAAIEEEDLAITALLLEVYRKKNYDVQSVWNILESMRTSTSAFSNVHDLYNAMAASGVADLQSMFTDRRIYRDSGSNGGTDNNCRYDQGEEVGATRWTVRNTGWRTYVNPSTGYTVSTGDYHTPSFTRNEGLYDPRASMLLHVNDPTTGVPLQDFDIQYTVTFDAPYQEYDFVESYHVDSSPYLFKAALFMPSIMKITILKEGIEPMETSYNYTEFWEASLNLPAESDGPLFTRTLGFDEDSQSPMVVGTADRQPDRNDWYNHTLTITWTGNDGTDGSGVASCDPATTYHGPDSLSASAIGHCTDKSGNTGEGTFTFKYDARVPTISGAATTSANANGWYKNNVVVHFEGSDATSRIAFVTPDVTLSIEDANIHAVGTAIDIAGNSATFDVTGINIDKTPPTITSFAGAITDGSQYYFGSVPANDMTCAAEDSLSGLDGSCTVSGHSTAVGSYTLTATAKDKAGNVAMQTRAYKVLPWTIQGFYAPIDMNEVVNVIKGGQGVPLKFEVFVNNVEKTSTSDIASFTQKKISCSAFNGDPQDAVEEVNSLATGLRYDETSGQFIANWKTPKQTNTCWEVKVTTLDLSTKGTYVKLT